MSDLYKESIPEWGPYSKKYMGISNIVDPASTVGARFDCVVFPTVANSAVPVPNVTVPSHYHPWGANADLSYFAYRYELEWKDRVYADVSFAKIDDTSSVIRVEFVNDTDLSQNCLLNYFCAIEYPEESYCRMDLPADSMMWKSTDYQSFDYANPRPWDMQNPDGLKKGEFRDRRFTGGSGLGDRIDARHVPQLSFQPFGCVSGDRVTYDVVLKHAYRSAVLCVRYRSCKKGAQEATAVFTASGIVNGSIALPYFDGLTVVRLPLGALSAQATSLTLTSTGAGGVELDCFVITEAEDTVRFHDEAYCLHPEIAINGSEAVYCYPGIDGCYGLRPLTQNVRYREIDTGALEDAMISRLSNSDSSFDDVTEPFTRSFARKHSDNGYYHNTIVHSIFIPPHASHVEYAVIYKNFCPVLSADDCERISAAARASAESAPLTQAGRPFAFSVRLLQSTLLVNAVYPIYKHGAYIVHFTPGKRWDSLYTWDSGFIGLGLLSVSPRLAEYELDTYLSDPSNPDYAFLFHGSPVPVQSCLWLEMLNRTNEKDSLLAYYPRARLYYEFLAGKAHGSTTARFQSGLTSTYDLFYSCSGMDDYPAQVYIHQHGLQRAVTPAISPSHAIRFAKILRMAALHCPAYASDITEYDADIARLTDALNRYAWDAQSGYYGYVVHDEQNRPVSILRDESGENLDKGFDGVYPLIAGAGGEHTAVLLAHLQSKKELFSDVGLSAVDMSSGYYSQNGYWNGCVWFSHQWFFFKTMFDLGQTGFAFQIADIALRRWKAEVDDSYNCFEMLHIATGRGGWFHQFGGLSAPISCWADAYYKKGTVTVGFDLWVSARHFSADFSSCTVDFAYHGNQENYAIMMVMDDSAEKNYTVRLNGETVGCTERLHGVIEVILSSDVRQGRLSVDLS